MGRVGLRWICVALPSCAGIRCSQESDGAEPAAIWRRAQFAHEFAVDAAAAKSHNNIHKQKRDAMKRIQNLCLFVAAAILLAANAHAGRWITRDPMEVQEHMERDPHPFLDLNPYTFNNNNPLSYIDPNGMAPQLVTVTGNLNGGLTGAGYVNYHQGQDYGIGLHGPIDTRPINFTLNVLGKIQQPIDATERWLKDSGNPFSRELGVACWPGCNGSCLRESSAN